MTAASESRAERRRTMRDPAIVYATPRFTRRPDLVRRRAALLALEAKYRGKPFDWAKRRTCVHMLRFHLIKLGHRLPPLPRIHSALAARRALDEHGWADTGAMLDALLERIAPAAMAPGDVCFRASADGFGSVLVAAGQSAIMGWFDNEETGGACEVMIMSLDQLSGAWRV